VGLAHRDQRPDGGLRARARQGVQGRERQLRLPAGKPLLGAKPRVPAGYGPIESRRLKVAGEQQQFETVRKRQLGKLRGHRPGQHEIPALERTLELRVDGSLGGHERMFSLNSTAPARIARRGPLAIVHDGCGGANRRAIEIMRLRKQRVSGSVLSVSYPPA
jgi:hypothetical protein